jgi:hypothetical protein
MAADRLWKGTVNIAVRCDVLAVQSAIASFIVFIFYRDSGVNLLAYEIVTCFVLGYLAFLSSTADKPGKLPSVASDANNEPDL